MSRGIGGVAIKVLEDDDTVIYQYGSYDLNRPGYENKDHIYDGVIRIQKGGIPEPVVFKAATRMKRIRHNRIFVTRRQIIKKRCLPVSVTQTMKDGYITVENCSLCSGKTPEGIDRIAPRLLSKIICDYQNTGDFPEKEWFDI